MATIHQLRDDVSHTLDRLLQGWRKLSQRASHAITRFRPNGDGQQDISSLEQRDTVRRNAGWGVLAAELHDEDDRIVVRLEAPGMEKDDFDIQVNDQWLRVSGEKRVEKQHSEGRYHIVECAYGRFERSIPLPEPVQSDGAKARYRRGVLTIELPRQAARRRRSIPVQSV